VMRLAILILVLAFARSTEAADPPKPLAELVKDLRDPDRIVRLRAVEAIREHHYDKILEVLPQLIEALGDDLVRSPLDRKPGEYLLQQTIWQTANLGPVERVKVASELTKHRDPQIRAGAFVVWWAAAESGDKVDLADLLAAVRRGVKDENSLVRAQATMSLRAFWKAPAKEAEAAIALLTAALEDRESQREDIPSPAMEAALALINFKAKARPAIPALGKVAALNHNRGRVVWFACQALNAIATSDAAAAEEIVKLLKPLITDKTRSNEVRTCAVNGVWNVGEAVRLVGDLAAILEEPGADDNLRSVAYHVLGRMGPQAAPAVPTLVRLLDRGARNLRAQRAVDAHRALGSSAVWLRDWDWFAKTVESNRGDNKSRMFDRLMANSVQREQFAALTVLSQIGPAAGEAVGAIEKWIEQADSDYDRRRGFQTLQAIKK